MKHRSGKRPRRRLLLATTGLAAVAALSTPGIAAACSQDNSTWLESFLDTSCLQTPLTNATLDALGGLRLDTNGTASNLTWDTDTHFASGITHDAVAFGKVGVSTLAENGTGPAAALQLPATLLPLDPTAASILTSTPSTMPDGDHVDSPSVVKTGTGYAMYYVGLAEDGSAPAIFRATSPDGKSWTRSASPNAAVLAPTPGAFDEMGVSGPHVLYDASDPVAPYKLYYAGQGKVFGAIGFATSLDGVTWVKHTGTASPSDPPVPVLTRGQGGSADSFATADPWVMKDGTVWKMWYTADDSNQKRIAYATSVDGMTWQKGGAVVTPGSPAIMKDDAFAPTVWKDNGGGFRMMFGGYNATSDQTKLVNATSSDGITWTGFGTGLPTAGSATRFDASNLNSPAVLDEGIASSERFKLYYSGNTVDANGNAHYRIGLATGSNGSSFAKFSPGGNDSVLDIAAMATAFDARSASGLSVTRTGGTGGATYVGFYAGLRGSDATWRVGTATSSDGASWVKVPVVTAGGNGGALFNLNPAGPGDTAVDDSGARDPAVLLDGTTYNLYYTGVDSGGVRRVLRISTPQDGTTMLPDNSAWTTPSAAALAGDASGFDADGVSHPSVIKDGATFVAYYTGHSTGSPEIGRATSATADLSGSTRAASPVIAKGVAGSIDANGAKDPVVIKVAAGDYRMLYSAIDADGIERLAYATSPDGSTWTKRGVVNNPSRVGYADDEVAIGASGMTLDDAEASATKLQVYMTGRDRTGRTHGRHATSDYPTPVTAAAGIPMGWATYQVGNAATAIRDWRSISRTSTGTGTELWLSFLQPYTIAGADAWSDFFPVTDLSTTEQLNLLLTVRGLRWQARLSGPSGSPSLDGVVLDNAPVQFHATGSATTLNVEPAATLALTGWGTLTVDTETFAPAGGGTVGGSVSVRNADTNAELIPAIALNTSGTTTQSLAAINPAQNSRLRLVFSLTSNGTATPKVTSTSVSYTAVPLTGPVALFSVSPTSGVARLAATLDASASRVPAGRTITSYSWDFDGNGVVDQVSATPTAAYTYYGGTWSTKLTITDSTGATSAPATVTVQASDPTAPINVAITGPATLSKPFQLIKPLVMTWGATDAESLIQSYTLTSRVAPIGGAFGAPTTVITTTASGTTFALLGGSTYCFKVTATSSAGLSTTSPERCTALPVHSFALAAKGTWTKKSKVGHLLNRYRVASARGASLSRSGVVAKRLSIVATRGKGMGTVSVWLGTTKLKTIKLAAASTRRRQVIPVATFTSIRKGTVKIVVETSGKPVIIEGLAVSKV